MSNTHNSHLFPTGIVTGHAFCNREKERAYLKKRFEQNAHVVLISPRRYGKSSLIAQFTQDQEIPFASTDLYPATSSKYVKNAISDGVASLLASILPTAKRAQEKLMHALSNMNPVIEVSAFGQKLKLTPNEKTDEEAIMKMLLSLDKAAQEMDKKLIFVMDEFQQIATIEKSHALEASIRHAVERSKNIFYIFSGSSRTLLDDMFGNETRPLYHLCDELRLNRIDAKHYRPFLLSAITQRWGETIEANVVDTILALTNKHPYYVNRLCRTLWDEDQAPSEASVKQTWSKYVKEQKADWVDEMIGKLSTNKRAVMAELAKQPTAALKGKEFSSRVNLSISSISRSASNLLKEDLIFIAEDDTYHVLNPAVETVLREDKYF